MIRGTNAVVLLSHRDGSQLGTFRRGARSGRSSRHPAPAAHGMPLEQAAIEKFLVDDQAMSQVKVVRQWRQKARGDRGGQDQPPAAGTPDRIGGNRGLDRWAGAIRAISEISQRFPGADPHRPAHVERLHRGVAASLERDRAAHGEGSPGTESFLKPGTVYLAPDNYQLGVSGRSRLRVSDDAPVTASSRPGSYPLRLDRARLQGGSRSRSS